MTPPWGRRPGDLLFWPRIELFVALLVALPILLLLYLSPAPVKRLEGALLDLQFHWRGPLDGSHALVAVVAIDEASLEQQGRWPWSRRKLAELLEKIDAAAPRTLVLDILFAEPERNPLLESRRWFEQSGIAPPELLRRDAGLADADLLLAARIAASGKVVQGFYFYRDGNASDEIVERVSDCTIDETMWRQAGSDRLIDAHALRTNIPVYSMPAGCGFLNFIPDSDGTLRFAPLLIKHRDFVLPSLALAGVHHHLSEAPLRALLSPFGVDLSLGERPIPLTEQGLMWINYYGPAGTLPIYSAADLFSGALPTDALRDKLVFVGVSAPGIEDLRSTPFDTLMPGTEIQAQIAANLLQGDMLRRPSLLLLGELLLVIAIALGYGLFFRRSIERTHGLLTLLLLALLLLFSHLLFRQGYWLHAGLLLLQMVSTFLLLYSLHFLRTLRLRQQLHAAFSQYVDPDVVASAVRHVDRLGVGGEEREISVLFLDLAGFTTLSERLTPQEVVSLINSFYDAVTAIVFRHGGCIDRLTGDGLIALFGAPIADPDHAFDAALTGLKLREALSSVAPVFERFSAPLAMRVGINSGRMVVGNMGSSRRMQYTFMGDAGNVAARLESLNKQYGTYRMIGEETFRLLAGRLLCRELDTVILVGKREPLTIYELIGMPEEAAQWSALLAGYSEALSLYRRGDFSTAEAAFAALVTIHGDPVSAIMAQRCHGMRAVMLANGDTAWDGIWRLKEK